MRYLVSFLFLTMMLFGFDYHLKPYTIVEGVECFFGLSSKITEVNGGNIVNTCYVQTDEGYLVIDSGPTYSYAQQAFREMKEKASLPVKYVINTSSDEVHILGNGFYQELGAKLMGPESYKIYEQSNIIDLKNGVTPKTFINTRITSLDTYVDSDLTFTLGGLEIKILKIDPKSDRYLMVYLPTKGILFAGDMVFNDRIPPLKNNRSLTDWLQSLNKIEKLPWKRLISSHGIKTKYSAIKNTTRYLKMLRDEVQGCLQNGLNKEACIQEVTMSPFIKERLYDKWHVTNVTTAYEQLRLETPPPIVPKKESVKPKEPKQTTKKELMQSTLLKEANKIPPPTLKTLSSQRITELSPLQNYPFNTAMKQAKNDQKIVLIKIFSNKCPYCKELDRIIRNNNAVKKLIRDNYIMVTMNNSREKLPLGIEVSLTPSLAFVRPDTKQVVMITPGIEALGELIDILKEGARDGRRNGYLK